MQIPLTGRPYHRGFDSSPTTPYAPRAYNDTGNTHLVPDFVISSEPELSTYNPHDFESYLMSCFSTFTTKVDNKLESIVGEIKKLKKRIETIEDKVEKIWYSPDCPGFVEAKKDFESLSLSKKK